jgi:hypothetical protein
MSTRGQHPVMPKVFTAASANRTLPLVRRIVEDLVRDYARWQQQLAACEVAAAVADSARDPATLALQREVQALAGQIEQYVDELTSLGAEPREPYDSGLVDFPGEVDGRPIYLCWRLGESSIEYWHEIAAGFPGRQSIHSLPASADTP